MKATDEKIKTGIGELCMTYSDHRTGRTDTAYNGYCAIADAAYSVESIALHAAIQEISSDNRCAPFSVTVNEQRITIVIDALLPKRTPNATARNALKRVADEYVLQYPAFAKGDVCITTVYEKKCPKEKWHDPDNIDTPFILNTLKGSVIADDSMCNISLTINAERGENSATRIIVEKRTE